MLAWPNPAAMIGESFDGSGYFRRSPPALNLFLGSERVYLLLFAAIGFAAQIVDGAIRDGLRAYLHDGPSEPRNTSGDGERQCSR